MDDIIIDLTNLAFENGISVLLTPELSPETPAVCDTESLKVIVNTNFKLQNQIPLQFAHEISHIMNGDHSAQPLYFTPSKRGIESSANEKAVQLLAPYYLRDKESEYVDVNEFMTMFAIPEHLRSVVNNIL